LTEKTTRSQLRLKAFPKYGVLQLFVAQFTSGDNKLARFALTNFSTQL
jgi:hypothetical protein